MFVVINHPHRPLALLPHTTARPLFASNCCIPATVAIMATGDEDSSEREEVPFSLVPPHDMTYLLVENKNIAARGSDVDRSDLDLTMFQRTVGETPSIMTMRTTRPVSVQELAIIMRMRY